MNFTEIKEIIALINQSNLTEFQVKDQQFELHLSKNQTKVSTDLTDKQTVARETTNEPPVAMDPVVPVSEPEVLSGGHQISSPLVGVIYLKPSPDKAVFKQIGDAVKKGEVLCIIEAMKVMNEIVSDVDGILTSVQVENEEVVEFGQVLFEVKEG